MLARTTITIIVELLLVTGVALAHREQIEARQSFKNETNQRRSTAQPPKQQLAAELESQSGGPPTDSSRLELRAGQNYLTPRQTELTAEYFFYDQVSARERRHRKHTLAEYSYMGALVKFTSAAYNDFFIHRYDSFKDLRESNSAQVNQETCIRQLEELGERADRSEQPGGTRSTDIEFLRFVDNYGRRPAGSLFATAFWTGVYDACLRSGVQSIIRPSNEAERIRGRYCVASLKFDSWGAGRQQQAAENELEKVIAFKTGICLPKTCDAQQYKNKHQLIKRLVDLSLPDFKKYGAHLSGVHCLPDEDSPLRAWWRSTPTLLVVCCTTLWLTFLAFATYKDATKMVNSEDKLSSLYKSLSVVNNLRSLFQVASKQATIGKEDQQEDGKRSYVNLDIIEGIKVLAACYIVTGHVIMVASMILKDAQDLGVTTSFAWRSANLMPAFAVNAFFVITGILTSYLMLKQNQSHSIITSPVKWLVLIIYRYLRIMPMYALVTLFCKHVARYLGDGPLWDYGTSSLAARRTCEQESWAWTLLFGANFKSPIKHCIPSAWYLANDFQFLLVTPLFLVLLHKRPKLGERLLILGAVVGYFAGFFNILSQGNAHDLRPVVMFWPHGFTTYVNFLYASYTQPFYRIPAYLMGLLFGHSLHQFELKRQSQDDDQQRDEPQIGTQKVEWPRWMARYGTAILLSLFVVCVGSPFAAQLLNFSRSWCKLLTAFIMPTYHLLYAFSIGLYILLATTGHGNKLINQMLSLKFWKPLARLSLCVVLVNVEVVTYIIETHRDFRVLNNQYHTCLNLLAILSTYLVATVVCVLFESPIRALLNHALNSAMRRAAVKEKAA